MSIYTIQIQTDNLDGLDMMQVEKLREWRNPTQSWEGAIVKAALGKDVAVGDRMLQVVQQEAKSLGLLLTVEPVKGLTQLMATKNKVTFDGDTLGVRVFTRGALLGEEQTLAGWGAKVTFGHSLGGCWSDPAKPAVRLLALEEGEVEEFYEPEEFYVSR